MIADTKGTQKEENKEENGTETKCIEKEQKKRRKLEVIKFGAGVPDK